MRPIRIDFAPPGAARDITRVTRLSWLAAAVALLAAGGALLTIVTVRAEQFVRQAELESLRAQLAAAAAPAPAASRASVPEVQANAINAAVMQLNLPWSSLLSALERATPASVALLELEPDARKQRLRGAAETRSSADMLAFIRGLRQQPQFANAVLKRHEFTLQGANQVLRFEFEADWLEAEQ